MLDYLEDEETSTQAMIEAGYSHGQLLAAELDISTTEVDFDKVTIQLNMATYLVVIDKIELVNNIVKVYLTETFSFIDGIFDYSSKYVFTLGMIKGLLETLLGKRLEEKLDSLIHNTESKVLEFVLNSHS